MQAEDGIGIKRWDGNESTLTQATKQLVKHQASTLPVFFNEKRNREWVSSVGARDARKEIAMSGKLSNFPHWSHPVDSNKSDRAFLNL